MMGLLDIAATAYVAKLAQCQSCYKPNALVKVFAQKVMPQLGKSGDTDKSTISNSPHNKNVNESLGSGKIYPINQQVTQQ